VNRAHNAGRNLAMQVLAERKMCPTCQGSFPAELDACPRDGSPLQEPGEWSVGQIIAGKYVVSRAAEHGPISATFSAQTLDFDEPRVLRVLRLMLNGNDAAVREFRRTARLLEKIAHPNLVTVEASGVAEDGRPFLVAEALEGSTLEERLHTESPFPPARACRIARQIASGLAAAHRLGLLHLALEPANVILIGPPDNEQVKVNRLGAAYVSMARAGRRRMLEPGNGSSASLTLRDLMPMAPKYCSPEQALGYPAELLDARSDLYALGVMFYQMLTGRLPVEPIAAPGVRDGEALAWLDAHLTQAPRPLIAAASGRDVPQQLADLVMQLLEKRIELRPATARAVAEEIELIEGGVAARQALQPLLPSAPTAQPEIAHAPVTQVTPLRAAEVELSDSALQPWASSRPDLDKPADEAATRNGAEKSSSAGSAYTSPIFRTEPPRAPVSKLRWVLAVLSTLVIAGGVWFFSIQARHGWLGSGLASPPKPDAQRSVQDELAQPAASPAPSSTTPAQPNAAALSNQVISAPAQQPVPAATPPPHRTAPAPAHSAVSAPDSREIADRVKSAVAAGDVFFGLGKYDLAIDAYERPLKLDPKNQLLHEKIERAQKAKAAEAEFLGKP
jgi:serine/threonine protein kinase